MNLKTITRTVLLSAALFAPSLAFAGSFIGGSLFRSCDNYICWLGDLALSVINGVLVPVLFAIAFIVFLYGIADAYILHPGDENAVKRGHKLVLWGIVGFAAMISIWGLVNVVTNTFGLAGFDAPPLPTSPVSY